MFQPDFEKKSNRNPAGRVGKLAFVVGDPAETRADWQRADWDHPRRSGADEENKWVSDRLMACYND